jgi:hypothetical protein
MDYRSRTYRRRVRGDGVVSFPVSLKESDLLISVDRESYSPELPEYALSLLAGIRRELEQYITRDQKFRRALIPHPLLPGAPRIARLMAAAARRAGVGPMAAVAGAVSEVLGRKLLPMAKEIIVENGGDIYFHTQHPIRVGVFAGPSVLSNKVTLMVSSGSRGRGVCTSSSTVGPSLSFGCADAAVVISHSAALADAAASTLGNIVQGEEDISPALEKVHKIKGILGTAVILGDKLGVMGDVELVLK